MDLHQYLRALRKFWWVICALAVLGGLSGAYAASNVVPKYRASTTFFVATSGDSTTQAAVQGDQFAQRRVNSYVALLSTDRLAEMVAETSDLDLSAGQVRGMIGGTGDVDTVLLTATVTSASRSLAAEVADAVAVDFVRLVDEVERSGDDPASVHLEVVSGPAISQLPVRTNLSILLRAGLGAMLGLVIAVLLELRDNTIRSEDELRAVTARPVLGRIPFDRRVRTSPLLVEVDHQSALAESFRQLRTNLRFLHLDRPVQVLVVTSSVADEGKSVTSSNLALSLAANDVRVLLIEADLRRPSVADHFGIDRSQGLTDVLAGQIRVESVLYASEDGRIHILPSGPLPPNPSELLDSAAMERLVDELRHSFDVIILDTPPLLLVSDGAVAAAWADGVILAVRDAKTTRQELGLAVRALSAVNARLLGVVVTMAAPGDLGRYGGYGPRDASAARPPKGGLESFLQWLTSDRRPRGIREDLSRMEGPDPLASPGSPRAASADLIPPDAGDALVDARPEGSARATTTDAGALEGEPTSGVSSAVASHAQSHSVAGLSPPLETSTHEDEPEGTWRRGHADQEPAIELRPGGPLPGWRSPSPAARRPRGQ